MVQGISPPNLGALLHIPITNAELDRARQSLMAQRTDMTDQQSWLDLLALYSLPANSFSQLSQQLDAIDTATLQHWLQTQLESDYYHTLSLPASP